MRHLHTLQDLDPETLTRLLDLADHLRGRRTLSLLGGRAVILLFFNPSLRTRVSMELAAQELGGRSVTLQPGRDVWKLEDRDGIVMNADKAEHVRDAVKVLGRYGDLIAVRAFARGVDWEEDRQDPVLRSFCRHSDVPVLNLESALYHPCQSFADLLTIRRALGDAPGPITLTWCDHPKALPVAVPSSFALAVTRMGWDLTIAHPEGYDLPEETLAAARQNAAAHQSSVRITHDRDEAFSGARVVYAKSWGRTDRYGNRDRELKERRDAGLARWIVDEAAMALTDEARFMHCLPVRRNVIVSDGVLDSDRALIYDEAENRLHGQKALLCHQLGLTDEAFSL